MNWHYITSTLCRCVCDVPCIAGHENEQALKYTSQNFNTYMIKNHACKIQAKSAKLALDVGFLSSSGYQHVLTRCHCHLQRRTRVDATEGCHSTTDDASIGRRQVLANAGPGCPGLHRVSPWQNKRRWNRA